MTHYQVLGVPRGATSAEIRSAYLRLARAHHPDHHVADARSEQVAAERRMREINAAWQVLSDPERRRRYDAELDLAPRRAVIEEEPERTWRPFDDDWDLDPDDLDPRLDVAAPRPRFGRVLAIAPVGFLVVGVACLVVGGVASLRALLALGFACLALSFLLFVTAPVAVVLESRRHDRL